MIKKLIDRLLKKDSDHAEQELSYEEIQSRMDKQVRKEKRKARIKIALFYMLLLFCAIGALRSFIGIAENKHSVIEEQTFVQTYAQNYFAYPADEEYLKKFTLSNWRLSYDNDIESAVLSDIEIYQVEELEAGAKRYYCDGDLTTKRKEQEAITAKTYFYIDAVCKDDRYLVIRPITNVSSDVKAISDEEQKQEYVYEIEKGNEQLSESEKEGLTRTLELFVKTYNDDVNQARLLCSDKDILDQLDPGMRLELQSIGTATKDDRNIYVSCEVTETHENGYSIKKKYHFTIEKEKNKINSMEVY